MCALWMLPFAALGDADLVLVVVDVSQPDPNAERYLVKKLKKPEPSRHPGLE